MEVSPHRNRISFWNAIFNYLLSCPSSILIAECRHKAQESYQRFRHKKRQGGEQKGRLRSMRFEKRCEQSRRHQDKQGRFGRCKVHSTGSEREVRYDISGVIHPIYRLGFYGKLPDSSRRTHIKQRKPSGKILGIVFTFVS